jgi:hypothetical protein
VRSFGVNRCSLALLDMGLPPEQTPLTALGSPAHGRCRQSRGTRIPLCKNRRDLTAGLQSLAARSHACNQAAALASSSYPEATLVLVPASRAAPCLLTT